MRRVLLLAVLAVACRESTRGRHPLLDPSVEQVRAPASYKVRFDTTKGSFLVVVNRDWAPHGADRLYNLVRMGFYDDVAVFRVVPGYVAQLGLHGDPAVSAAWMNAFLPPDRPKQSNRRGFVTFAQTRRGAATRTTQVFVNLADNPSLDRDFAPVGEVVVGMDVVDALYGGYGEPWPQGAGPPPNRILYEGNEFLRAQYPKLDYIERATLVD